MKLTRNLKLYLIALAVCAVGYFYTHPANAGTDRLPADATQEHQFRFYCPQLESVTFSDDGQLKIGTDVYVLQFGHVDTLTFQGAKGIVLMRGEAQPDGGLFLDKSTLTVGGREYQCVII